MTEQEAIEWISPNTSSYKVYIAEKNGENPLNYINEAIEVAIKALENRRWIPCSEQLPKKSMRVLTTLVTLNGVKDIQDSWYMLSENKFLFYQGFKEYSHETKIIAWMPIPNVYEGE